MLPSETVGQVIEEGNRIHGSPIVSIVIPTYNRAGILKEALLSIEGQTYPNIQVIVTDDSTNNTVAEMIEGLQTRTRIEYYRNDRRLGLPANRNRGIAKASGDLVMSLDDDTVMEKNCVERLVMTYIELASNGQKVGAIGPAVVSDSSRRNEMVLMDFAARRYLETHGNVCVRGAFTGLPFMDFTPSSNQVTPVEELHSSSMYPREVLSLVGGYEERLYQGNFMCEETDLHARIRRQGFGLFYEPRSILHHRPASSGGCSTDSVRYAYFYFRNQSIYSIRNNGIRSMYQIPSLIVFMVISGLRGYFAYRISTTASETEE